MNKSCCNCSHSCKETHDGYDTYTCTDYQYGVGIAMDVTPPYDRICKNWVRRESVENLQKGIDI